MSSETTRDIGVVLRIDAKICHVDLDGREVRVPLAGKLFERRGGARPVAVGDRVRLARAAESGGDFGAIDEVLPRTSELARKRAGEDERQQVLAANISLVLAVAAVREPPFQPLLVDGILAAAARQELTAALALTKMDRDKKGEAARWIELYRGLGFAVYPTSIAPGHETRDVLDELARVLHENVTVLCGASGAGKSSLLNTLVPGLDLRIGSLGRIRQGKHTTTHTRLIRLPGGGHVLDTPGIRSFGLYGTDPSELTFYFPELARFVGQCAYRNCTHLGEPDCAVIAAIERGEIAPSRWDSYVQMHRELA